MMKILAIYTLVVLTGFSIYSIYFALVGDNSPLWFTICILCLPAIAFALIFLVRKR